MLAELRLLILFHKAYKEALTGVKVDNTVKPGWKTSEFWLHLLAMASGVLAIVPGVPAAAVVGVAAISNLAAAWYSYNRTDVKTTALSVALDAGTQAANAAADAIKRAMASAPVTVPPAAPAPVAVPPSAPTPAAVPAGAPPAPAAAVPAPAVAAAADCAQHPGYDCGCPKPDASQPAA